MKRISSSQKRRVRDGQLSGISQSYRHLPLRIGEVFYLPGLVCIPNESNKKRPSRVAVGFTL